MSATLTGTELFFGEWMLKGVVGYGAFGAVETAVSKKGKVVANQVHDSKELIDLREHFQRN